MKVPISWLREYVDVEATAAELADRLTFSGVEVEGIETIGSDFAHIVVGEITEVRAHPRADRLTLCTVSDGTRTLPVVCGATNVEPGAKVVLALPGAELPGGLKIARAKLRGEVSEGMLCAEDELGLGDDHSGILRLPASTAAGTPFSAIAGPPETVLDLEITWNRPDCLSIMGIAREVAALYGRTMRRPSVDLAESAEAAESLASVAIEDPDLCPRYAARVIRGVRWIPSAAWMQRRLRLCGVRPISLVVDVTNYVMLECGHPLHAFDYRLVGGHRIVVRRPREGEAFSTLDGVARRLTPGMLVIADAERPVALAGIMGGAGSEIREDTTDVLLESAVFSPANIHRTSQALGLKTESSYRYERGVSPELSDWASRRAARLIGEGGAVVARGVVDVYPGRKPERLVACRYARVKELLGVEVPRDRVNGIFEALELPVVERTAEHCTVSVPSFRGDIELEADLIEEVARIHGLDKVPAALPDSRPVPGVSDLHTRSWLAFRANLVGLGLTEVVHYSFLSAKELDLFDPTDGAARVVLPNPVSTDQAVLRHTLIPQMVLTLGRNAAHQVREAALFEMGKVFEKDATGRVFEQDRLSLGLMGIAGRAGVDVRRPLKPDEMFLWMKGIVEQLLAAQHVGDVQFTPSQHASLEAGWAARILAGDRLLGTMGLLSERLSHEWRMGEPVAVAELVMAPLLEHGFDRAPLKPVPSYPAISRDVAMVVAESVTHESVVRTIRSAASRELTDVQLFDIFRSNELGCERKSLAYSLTYRSQDKTLTDEEVNALHERVRAALRDELKAELR